MSGSYRKAYDRVLPHAPGVADPFGVSRLANQRLDEVRRRVQNETLGHRGRKDDPLYRIRRLLTAAHERISDRGQTRLRGLLDAGDPHGEVRTAWHAKETVTRHLRDRQSRPRSPIHPRARRRPPGRILPTRDQQAGTYHRPLDPPDHQLAHLEGNQRTHRSPQQPHQSGSNASRSGYPTSRTTESGHSSTRGNPTGTCRPPSLPTEIHSYLEGSWAGTGLTQLKSGLVPFHRSVGLFPAWGVTP